MSIRSIRSILCGAVAAFVVLCPPAYAADDLLITEFMAVNSGPLVDEDGETSDWIEIHNPGTNAVNLNGWFLTDKASDLTQWSFPATNLSPNGYLIVFASGKDHRVPGAPLHTSFQLKSGGEYLGLVRPDGVSVVSEYSPLFPAQVSGVSYGLPVQQFVTTLIASGATARVLVPLNGALGATWTTTLFDDSSWSNRQTGVGFETGAPGTLTVVADSAAEFSGTQGQKNWYYGFYNKTADTVVTGYQVNDFTLFPSSPGPHSTNNFWDGASWHWWNGDPPYDEIGESIMNPNGSNNGSQHWVIRRWRSEISGSITVAWHLAKASADGNGVTGRILQNGTLRDSVVMPGSSTVPANRTVVITNVQPGDAIDIALDPLGISSNTTDTGDRCLMSALISGYPSLTGQFASNLGPSMSNVNATAYLRIPFNVTDPSTVEFLTLRMKYDDGFIAYLNGQQVVSANAPTFPEWNSTANASRSDVDVLDYQEFNLTPSRGLLQPGTNVLAIQGLNASAADPDFLILPELIASRTTLDATAKRYFAVPTPGAVNGFGTTNLGPLIPSAAHAPNVPQDNEDLFVTARVLPTFNAVSSVRLIYRVMYSNEVNVPMFDDGAHGDGLAGDGLFGASIPASASTPGQMVRYYIYATDARTNSSRFPPYDDPQNSPQYQGTVVFNPGLSNPLPVLHMFVQNPTLATNYTGTRCSLFYGEEFYDNVAVNLHGQTTASVFNKRGMDIDMNSGHHFQWSRQASRVHDFNLISTAPDKDYMRQVLAYETFAAAGVPGSFAFPVRLQQNNALYGVMHLVEENNNDFLDRLGLDPNGALYKVYLPLTNAYAGVAEKKTRKEEDNADLQALINGCKLTGTPLRNYLYDNIDIAELVNFLATIQLVQNEDCCDYKNYYLYHDNDGSGEWQMMPWDLDLTFGRTFTEWVCKSGVCTGGYYDTNIYWTNRWYSERGYGNYIGNGMPLGNALLGVPDIYNMFLIRWSSVHDNLLQRSNTHPLLLKFERRVNELTAQIGPDAGPDLAKWGTFAPTQTQAQAAAILKTNYFAPRRGWVFNTLRYPTGPYLDPQPSDAVINFGAIEFNPSSGNQAQEYVQLVNPYTFNHIDISGWRLAGAIDYTFRGGTVITVGGSIYVSPDVKAFRARPTGPRGGQGLYVQGNFKGQLSARGETLQLFDKTGRLVAATNFPGNPSPAQQFLRVTEIMYHPAPPPPGLATNADEFEFLEVKNIGPVSLNLAGVRFVRGVEFSFSGSLVTNLPPGASAVVVRNLAAFTSRYGPGLNVAGSFAGSLDNQGENLRLEDASGEVILDFDYDNKWYPITDGLGFSLVIVDDTAPWNSWGLKSSWRTGSAPGGSPGQPNPLPPSPPALLITEALTHTDLPALDTIELFNPTAGPVDLNGWYLSDDFNTPRKYRIQNRPSLPPGGFATFDENDFNALPGAPGSFSLSSKGDEAYLFSADAAGNLTGYYHGFAFGAAANGVTFGRYVTSMGQEHFVAQISPTLGGPNSGPLVGPVVISELHYHPPDLADGSDNSADEFVELQNITAAAVALFDPLHPTNTWQLRGVVDFDFPTNLTLASGAGLVVVNFNPTNTAQLADFRARFGLPAGVPVLGPYSGKLDNSSGTVKLSKPDGPDPAGVPYVLVDEVDYADTAPWPGACDGAGPSLQRLAVTQYGNDPINWTAAAPSAGRPFGSGTPPVIVVQPANQTVLASGSPAFSVSATGTAPLRYQWSFNGTNIAGATSSSVILPGVLAGNAGSYQVTVFNDTGSAVSSSAILTVLYSAYFTLQPQGLTVRPGSNVTFTASAVGSTSIRYQWRRNGADLPNATNASLSVANVQFAQAGDYQVVATDNIGSLPSVPARLTVLIAPLVTQQPQSQTVVTGAPVVFSVSVSNSATLPLSYTWRNTPPGGATLTLTNIILSQTNCLFTIANATSADAGNYTVAITNEAGAATPSVTANSYLTVVVPPVDGTAAAGSSVTFSAQASGTAPLTFQWRFNGTNISGATSTNLTLANVQAAAAGPYTFVVTNASGTPASFTATLAITSQLISPVVIQQPVSQTVATGAPVTFSVSVSNTPTLPITYIWRKTPPGGATVTLTNIILNQTNCLFTIAQATDADAGTYTVAITNAAGPATPSLTTNCFLTVVTPPVDQTVLAGSNVTFSAQASGTAPLTFQWRFNGTNITGATSTNLTLANVQAAAAGPYTFVVTNASGTPASFTATLAVLPQLIGPVVIQQPVSQTVETGAPVTFSVSVSNTATLPITYTWRKTPPGEATVTLTNIILNQTNCLFAIAQATDADAGTYTVAITNAAGPAAPSLTTNCFLTVVTPPVDQTVLAGSNVTFSAQASGTAPLTFQWQFNGNNITGATNASLDLANVPSGAEGLYTVVVANAYGTPASFSATLTVHVPPSITQQPASVTAAPGSNVTFSVTASGTGPLGYQWFFNQTNALGGANTATLQLDDAQAANEGSYSVQVTNSFGSVTSQLATLTLLFSPVVTQHPVSQTVEAGTPVTFSVSVSDTPTLPISYLWQLTPPGGATVTLTNIILSQTNCLFLIANATDSDAGTYTVAITNAAGAATPSLTTNCLLTVVTPPVAQTVNAGSTATFTAPVAGPEPLTFQWQFNGSNIDAATTTSLILTNVQFSADGFYTFIVTDAYGTPASYSATLTVLGPPAITQQPLSVTVAPGSNVTFSVTATGPGTIGYQWFYNGSNALSGADSATLLITNAQAANEGSYSVTVTNEFGPVTSAPATLNIIPPPQLSGPQMLEGGAFLLFLSGFSNQNYLIEFSTNFLDWTPGVLLNYSNGLMPWTDTTATNASQRFYRGRLAP